MNRIGLDRFNTAAYGGVSLDRTNGKFVQFYDLVDAAQQYQNFAHQHLERAAGCELGSATSYLHTMKAHAYASVAYALDPQRDDFLINEIENRLQAIVEAQIEEVGGRF